MERDRETGKSGAQIALDVIGDERAQSRRCEIDGERGENDV